MKNVNYIAFIDKNKAPGVFNKVQQTVNAIRERGFSANASIIKPEGFKSIFSFYSTILFAHESHIVIRSAPYLMMLMTPILIVKRIQGKKIIIDIPTPNVIALKEISSVENMKSSGKILRKAIIATSFPWALYPATRVLQYAPESKYFNFGVKHKTLLAANGINVASIPILKQRPTWPSSEFVLIGVASLAEWHGFDRVISGIASHMKTSKQRIRFIIVGDGETRQKLEKLAEKLQVKEHIEFKGFLHGEELDAEFEKAHIAVSSLGLYRKGLSSASDLKSREYTSRGIPFIFAGYDIDFDPQPNFVFLLENDSSLPNINCIIDWYSKELYKSSTILNIRNHAVEHLDYSNKVSAFLLD